MSFRRFGSLPPELRIQIWEDALSVPTIWAPVFDDDPYSDLWPYPHPKSMKFIGPAPYLVGLACRESRWLLERLFMKVSLESPGPSAPLGAYWVRLDRTVIHFGEAIEALAALHCFDRNLVSGIQHITLQYTTTSRQRYYALKSVCLRLAASCPDLRTIIIHLDSTDSDMRDGRHKSFTVRRHMASLYTALSLQTRPDIGVVAPAFIGDGRRTLEFVSRWPRRLKFPHHKAKSFRRPQDILLPTRQSEYISSLRDQVLGCFGNSPPNLYFLQGNPSKTSRQQASHKQVEHKSEVDEHKQVQPELGVRSQQASTSPPESS